MVKGLIKIIDFLDSKIVFNEIYDVNDNINVSFQKDIIVPIEFDMHGGRCETNDDVCGYVCVFDHNNGLSEDNPKRYWLWNIIYETREDAEKVHPLFTIVQLGGFKNPKPKKLVAEPLW